MGIRNLTTNDLKITIINRSNQTIVVASAKITPGQARTIPLRHITENYQRALDLSQWVNSLKVEVVLNGELYDYQNVGPLTPDYLATIGTPSAMPYNAQVSGITADRPLNTSVPVGFMYFDTTLSKPVYNTGAAWVDGAGVVS